MSSVDLSPIEFFMLAGPIGRAVMVILLTASVWCWVLIIEGVIGYFRLKSALRAWNRGEATMLLAPVIEAADAAADLRIHGESVGETRHRIIETMNRAARVVVANAEGGLANLAVISSVAPFVGLFGTVWGIMSSFTAIAAAKDTSLAVVAPGIAEALATTAVGLACAIPASVGYTRIGAAIGSVALSLAGQIEEAALRAVTPSAASTSHHHGIKEVV